MPSSDLLGEARRGLRSGSRRQALHEVENRDLVRRLSAHARGEPWEGLRAGTWPEAGWAGTRGAGAECLQPEVVSEAVPGHSLVLSGESR